MDLAKEGEFELGGLRIRPALRQIDSRGGSETLEPRIMQVLVALARKRGDVVSRDQLIQECWGGLAVGEDSISRCIYRLRKLGESTGAFSLETITKVGYRLIESERAAASDLSPAPAQTPPQPAAEAAAKSWVRRSKIWLAAGAALVLLAAYAVWLAWPAGRSPDVDTVIARLSERLRQQAASETEIAQARQAVQVLGASDRPEERTAFEALTSDDGARAISILEELAAQIEASGDRKAAAMAYRRFGALAVLSDRARAVAAQRKAFALDPTSLAVFQSTFVMHTLIGAEDTVDFANTVLADRSLSERMRGWALAHRAMAEIDFLGEADKGRATLAEIKKLKNYESDAVLQVFSTWIEAYLAFSEQRMAEAVRLAELAKSRWEQIPERTTNNPETLHIRVVFAQGDWSRAFAEGSTVLERRVREGDLLPGSITGILCETGHLTGQSTAARPYCASAVRRNQGPAFQLKAYEGMDAAAAGDAAGSRREFALAEAMLPSSGPMAGWVRAYAAWGAIKAGEIDRAVTLLSEPPSQAAWDEIAEMRPSTFAMGRRILAEGLIAAGQPKRACAPLAEAEEAYMRIGADPGLVIVETLRRAAGCPA